MTNGTPAPGAVVLEAPAVKALKALEDLTEPEMRELATRVLNAVQSRLPVNTGFAVLFWPHGEHRISQYGSNCRREDTVLALREVANRLERRQDVPR